MKTIIRKTQAEYDREEALAATPMKVKDTLFFYWSCEKCNAAFFDEDIILVSKDGSRCPLEITSFLGNKICGNRMYGGDSESFNKYHKVCPSSIE